MTQDLAVELDVLMQTSRDWAAAAASGDLERALAYWTDDAIVLPPDQPAVVGQVRRQSMETRVDSSWRRSRALGTWAT